MVKKLPGRSQTPIKTVKVKKIPSDLKIAFKGAIAAKLVDIVYENSKDVIVYVYEEIEGPLGEFLDDASVALGAAGYCAVKLAEEAFEEAIEAGETVVKAIVEGTTDVVYTVGKTTDTMVSAIIDGAADVVNTVGKTTADFVDDTFHAIGSVADDIGSFFSGLF